MYVIIEWIKKTVKLTLNTIHNNRERGTNMTYSNRLKNFPKHFFSTLVDSVEAAMAEGRDVINLGRGNPDQPTPDYIVKAMQEAVADTTTHGYSPFRGLLEVKEAVASYYKREFDVHIDPETEVAVLGGTKTGTVEIPFALLDEQELLLLPDPGYPDYLSSVSLGNLRAETFPLLEENQFLPDYSSFTEEQKRDAKLMYLNYPSNPTAATATKEFFDKTVTFAKEHDIRILHDFAYGAIGFEDGKPVSYLQGNGAKDIGIELLSMSKTYNMAGWRIGFAVGNAEMIEAINTLQDYLFVSVFPAIQKAAAHALNGSQEHVDELVELYARRRKALLDSCEQIGLEVACAAGSFFAWIKVPKDYTSQEFSDLLLNKADVAVTPGNGFGEHGEGYVRVGLLDDEKRIQEAIERIGKLDIFQK